MSFIKSVVVAASLVAIAASAHASSREDLNSGYHGNTPVWNTPYGPTDAIEEEARGAYGQGHAGQGHVRAPRHVAPRHRQAPVVR
jgi:hypothetical protein